MKKGQREAVGDAISNIVKPKSLKENKPMNFLQDASKRRLRSNYYEFPKTEQELLAAEPKYNIEDLPMVDYSGKIHYLSDFYDICLALDDLIKKIDETEGEGMVGVAFDMEWTFNFQTGPEKTSLIQVCVDLEQCFLFHLPLIKKIPASLSTFLKHPRVQLHGVNIKNDLRKLERDFPHIKSDDLIAKCIDLGVWYNEVCGSSGRWSMERLVLQTLKLRIDKSRQVRMSKWHVFPLNKNQQKYAAIDVFVSRFVKFKSQQLMKQMIAKRNLKVKSEALKYFVSRLDKRFTITSC